MTVLSIVRNITVKNYMGQVTDKIFAITIRLHQHGNNIYILLSQIKVKINKAILINCTSCKGSNSIRLEKSHLQEQLQKRISLFMCG